MKFRFILVLFLIQFYLSISAQSESPFKISLLTYSSGQEIYSTFGHSAIRVRNNINQTDFVYNYGTFEFDTPGFYAKFIKGKLLYRLSRVPTEYVIRSTERENRSIIENELLLTPLENQRLVQILEENYLPENRSYLYDFFFDNCATKIVDIVNSATNNRFQMRIKYYSPTSFNQLLKPHLKKHKWAQLGMNIVIGIYGQRKASAIETSFLPNYLHRLFNESIDKNSSLPLISEDKTLISSYSTYPQSLQISPLVVFLLLFILILAIEYIEIRNKKVYFILDYLIIGIPILIGSLLLLFWIISDHYIYAWNHSILWANPFFVFHFIKKYRGKLVFQLATLSFICLALITSALFDRSITILVVIIIIGLRILPAKGLLKKLVPNIV